MYVSDVQVLRRFAQKLAATGGGGSGEPEIADTPEGGVNLNEQKKPAAAKPAPSPTEPKMPKGGTTFNELAKNESKNNPLEAAVNSGRRSAGEGAVSMRPNMPEMSTMEMLQRKFMRGVGHLGSYVPEGIARSATPLTVGGGAVAGAGALYALARAMQSEEQRKKKTPILAPAVGAVGGAALGPLLAELLSARKSRGVFNTASATPIDTKSFSAPVANQV